MGNSKASSVAQLPVAEGPGALGLGPEQARDFHFAVTWVGLFAHLDPIEAAGPRHRFENPSPSLALVPVVASALLLEQRVMEQRADQDSSSAWEMVVPKMIRTGPRTFIPAEDAERRGEKPELL
jgi:hypothetical protein